MREKFFPHDWTWPISVCIVPINDVGSPEELDTLSLVYLLCDHDLSFDEGT